MLLWKAAAMRQNTSKPRNVASPDSSWAQRRGGFSPSQRLGLKWRHRSACPESITPDESSRSTNNTWGLHPTERQSGLTAGFSSQHCQPPSPSQLRERKPTAWKTHVNGHYAKAHHAFVLTGISFRVPLFFLLLHLLQLCSSLPPSLPSFSWLPRT